MQNFNTLVSIAEHYLVANPEDRLSQDKVHTYQHPYKQIYSKNSKWVDLNNKIFCITWYCMHIKMIDINYESGHQETYNMPVPRKKTQISLGFQIKNGFCI